MDDIAEYLKTGTNALATASGPMAEAVENSTSRLSLADLRAIAVYLKDQPAAAEKPPAALAADDPLMQAGKAIYADECAACHTLDGSGIARLFPSLKGRASVQSAHADSLINVMLNGTRAAATGWCADRSGHARIPLEPVRRSGGGRHHLHPQCVGQCSACRLRGQCEGGAPGDGAALKQRQVRCSVLRRKPVRWVALAIRNAASAPDRMKRAPISM